MGTYVNGDPDLPWSASIAVPSAYDPITANSVVHGFRSLADRTALLYAASASIATEINALEAYDTTLSTSVAADITVLNTRTQAVYGQMRMANNIKDFAYAWYFGNNLTQELSSSAWQGYGEDSGIIVNWSGSGARDGYMYIGVDGWYQFNVSIPLKLAPAGAVETLYVKAALGVSSALNGLHTWSPQYDTILVDAESDSPANVPGGHLISFSHIKECAAGDVAWIGLQTEVVGSGSLPIYVGTVQFNAFRLPYDV